MLVVLLISPALQCFAVRHNHCSCLSSPACPDHTQCFITEFLVRVSIHALFDLIAGHTHVVAGVVSVAVDVCVCERLHVFYRFRNIHGALSVFFFVFRSVFVFEF